MYLRDWKQNKTQCNTTQLPYNFALGGIQTHDLQHSRLTVILPELPHSSAGWVQISYTHQHKARQGKCLNLINSQTQRVYEYMCVGRVDKPTDRVLKVGHPSVLFILCLFVCLFVCYFMGVVCWVWIPYFPLFLCNYLSYVVCYTLVLSCTMHITHTIIQKWSRRSGPFTNARQMKDVIAPFTVPHFISTAHTITAHHAAVATSTQLLCELTGLKSGHNLFVWRGREREGG